MDKIKLLQSRRRALMDAGKGIRKDIEAVIDSESFVELSTFSFSKSEFYDDDAQGEGVVTGFATVNGYPFYVVAQNAAVLSGGIGKANSKKIVKCLESAEKNHTPVIYFLSSLGVRYGEGVSALEGISELILTVARLKGSIEQYLVVNGEVYGQIAMLAGLCDFNFFIDKKSVLAANSPLVIGAADNLNLKKEQVGAASALKNAQLATFAVKDLAEVKAKITAVCDLISERVSDCEELNVSLPALNKSASAEELLKVFDKDSVIELGSSYVPEVKCVLGRIGGIAVAASIFDAKGGVKLDAQIVRKLKDFAEFVCCRDIPYVTFVNTLGIKESVSVNDSLVLKELGEYINMLDCMTSPRISVISGKAIGLGYTVFASKSMGYDFTYAFANAQVALFDSVQGAEIEFEKVKKIDKSKMASRYSSENADPINAAHDGYIDDVIEPAFVRQYLIASLQMAIN